jgi:hypothetical protein
MLISLFLLICNNILSFLFREQKITDQIDKNQTDNFNVKEENNNQK